MAITLSEAAKLSQNDLQRGVVETFVWESVILDRLPLMPIEGNAFAYNEELTLPGAAFRAVNAGYVESTGTVNQKTESLYILGGDADVDTFVQKTRSNLNDQRAVQTRLKVKSAVATFQENFINGDNGTNPEEFDGLLQRLTGDAIIEAGGAGNNGLPIVGANDTDRHAFMDALDEAIAYVAGGADALYMNKTIRAKLASAARRLGFWDRQRDEFGKVVEFYNGIPMLDIGDDVSGNPIITVTETQGISTDSSSIYVVKFSDDESTPGVAGLANGDVEVRDLGEIDSKPVYRTRIEFFCGLAAFGKGAARLVGARNA